MVEAPRPQTMESPSSPNGGKSPSKKKEKRLMRSLVEAIKSYDGRDDVQTIHVSDAILESKLTGAQDFFDSNYPTQSQITARLSAAKQNSGQFYQDTLRDLQGVHESLGKLGPMETEFIDEGHTAQWAESVDADEPVLNSGFRGIISGGSIIIYNPEKMDDVYIFCPSNDEAAVVDPAKVFESEAKAGCQALKKAKRFDDKPFPAKKDTGARKGGWTKKGKSAEFLRDEASLIEFVVSAMHLDGMPAPTVKLALARVREMGTNPLVAGDNEVSDACQLHERGIIFFDKVVKCNVGGAPATDKTPEKKPNRVLHFIPVQRGTRAMSPVMGGCKLLQYAFSIGISHLAIAIQDAVRSQSLHVTSQAVCEREKINPDEVTDEQKKLLQEHLRNVDFPCFIGFRAPSSSSWINASTALTVDLIRASAIVGLRGFTERGVAALLGIKFAKDAKDGFLPSVSPNRFWEGPNISLLDCIAAVPMPDPKTGKIAEQVLRVFQGVPTELCNQKHITVCAKAFRKRMDIDIGTSVISERAQLDSIVYKSVLETMRVAMGEVHAAMWASREGNSGTPLQQSLFMMLSVERASCLEVYRQETGQLIPHDNVQEFVTDALTRLKSAGLSESQPETEPVAESPPQDVIDKDNGEGTGLTKTKSTSDLPADDAVEFDGPREGFIYTTRDGKTDYFKDTDIPPEVAVN